MLSIYFIATHDESLLKSISVLRNRFKLTPRAICIRVGRKQLWSGGSIRSVGNEKERDPSRALHPSISSPRDSLIGTFCLPGVALVFITGQIMIPLSTYPLHLLKASQQHDHWEKTWARCKWRSIGKVTRTLPTRNLHREQDINSSTLHLQITVQQSQLNFIALVQPSCIHIQLSCWNCVIGEWERKDACNPLPHVCFHIVCVSLSASRVYRNSAWVLASRWKWWWLVGAHSQGKSRMMWKPALRVNVYSLMVIFLAYVSESKQIHTPPRVSSGRRKYWKLQGLLRNS